MIYKLSGRYTILYSSRASNNKGFRLRKSVSQNELDYFFEHKFKVFSYKLDKVCDKGTSLGL